MKGDLKMRIGFVCSVVAALAVACWLGPAVAAAQTPGEAAGTWNPPRTPDGQPDIRGSWGGGGASVYSLEEPLADRAEHIGLSGQGEFGRKVIIDPADGRIPYQPWAAARRDELHRLHRNPPTVEQIDPVTRCFLAGVPRIGYGGARIMQIPGHVVFLYEYPTSTHRAVPLDAGPHVGQDLKLWLGDSRGRWEGNTLVIETTNHNDRTWFDIVGDFHSEALRVVERWTYVDADTLNYEVTIEDPEVFTQPWTMTYPRARVQDPEEQWESAACAGNQAVEVILDLDRGVAER